MLRLCLRARRAPTALPWQGARTRSTAPLSGAFRGRLLPSEARCRQAPFQPGTSAVIASRALSDSAAARDVTKELAEFQDQFAEARMCFDDAQESKDTSYFKDDIEDAKEAMDKTVEVFEALLTGLD